MRIFVATDHVINLDRIDYIDCIDAARPEVSVNGTVIKLSARDANDLKAVLSELHRKNVFGK